MSPSTLSELLKLSEAERIQLAQDLWDSIPPTSDALPPTEAQIEEWDRRIAEHRADPSSAIPWEEARARLRERYGA
jgi:putative addiction module component (TIGR02574 family)